MSKKHLSSVEIEGSLRLPPGVTVTLNLIGNHDLVVPGMAGTSVIRLIAGDDPADPTFPNATITGLAGGTDGQVLLLVNVGTVKPIFLDHELVASLPANRFLLPLDTLYVPPDTSSVAIHPYDGVLLWYDGTSQRWRIIFKQIPTYAPRAAPYLVTATGAFDNTGMDNIVVVGATPGGELGGTWDAPTVDPTHSGSSHAEIQGITEDNLMEALADAVAGFARKWVSAPFGSGDTNTFSITHNLNTTELASVTLWRKLGSNWWIVALATSAVEILDANTINLTTPFTPTGNDAKVVIVY